MTASSLSGKVGFVVLNFGRPDMALRACASIAELVDQPHLVLVDNFSSKENRDAAEREISGMGRNCMFLPLPENRGYAAGMNAGLECLFESTDIDLAFAVNSDVMMRKFDLKIPDPGSECLLAVTVVEDGRSRVGASSFLPWLCRRRDVGSAGELSGPGCVYVEGCFVGLSRSLFEVIEGFSEDYFLYFEELDLVYKYRHIRGSFPHVTYAPGIIVEHIHGGATGMRKGLARSAFAEYWSSRSRIVFMRRHMPWFLCSALTYNVLLALRALLGVRPDLAKAVWKGTRDALCAAGWVPQAWRART